MLGCYKENDGFVYLRGISAGASWCWRIWNGTDWSAALSA
ncbi:Unannotated [Lentimonas sp. CC19]|nr:Unannotated [Lentimonas sp. CC19]CAA6690740.1 Unannotated [Lentimonas sp. CC10]CAA7068562.1 Unannotated [Lentimonas sp. CC11]